MESIKYWERERFDRSHCLREKTIILQKRMPIHMMEPASFRNGVYYSYTILKSEGFAYLVYVVELLPSEELYSNILVALVA